MNSPLSPPRLERALQTWPLWFREMGLTEPGQAGLEAPPRLERELQGGLSNRSWLVQTGQGRAVVRLNSPHDRHFNIDRQRERRILETLSGEYFAPEIWYCNPDCGLLVTRFVEGETLTAAALHSPAVKEQVAAILSRLRNIALPLPRFDYWQHLCHYRNQLLELAIAIPTELEALHQRHGEALQLFQQAHWQPVLTHHDLNPPNIIATHQGLVVIDWEYAAMGYGGMDSRLWTAVEDHYAEVVDVYRQLINGYWLLLQQAL